MDIFDDLKKKAKDVSDKIDWDEINKKKDAAIQGAKHIKSDYEARQREKKEDSLFQKEVALNELEKELDQRGKAIKREDWLTAKEAELKQLEEKLGQREKVIRKKETKLSQKFFLRFVLLAGGFALIGAFVLTAIAPQEVAPKPPKRSAAISQNASVKVSPARLSVPNNYTSREKAVYGAYNDMNTTNPNFDVGGYCLEKEKRGGITFEECIGVAAAKLMR